MPPGTRQAGAEGDTQKEEWRVLAVLEIAQSHEARVLQACFEEARGQGGWLEECSQSKQY